MKADEFLALTPEERQVYCKRLVQDMLLGDPRGVKELAWQLGKSIYTLYKWGDPEAATHNMPLHHLAHLIILTRNLSVLDWLEDLAGRVALPRPQAPAGPETIVRESSRAIKEFGEYLHEIQLSLEDGRLSRRELERIARECREAMAQLAALQAAVEEFYRAQRVKQ